MTPDKSKKFSDRLELVKGEKCEASWKVHNINGAYTVTCRTCKTFLTSGHTPKCLLNEKP